MQLEARLRRPLNIAVAVPQRRTHVDITTSLTSLRRGKQQRGKKNPSACSAPATAASSLHATSAAMASASPLRRAPPRRWHKEAGALPSVAELSRLNEMWSSYVLQCCATLLEPKQQQLQQKQLTHGALDAPAIATTLAHALRKGVALDWHFARVCGALSFCAFTLRIREVCSARPLAELTTRAVSRAHDRTVVGTCGVVVHAGATNHVVLAVTPTRAGSSLSDAQSVSSVSLGGSI